MPKRRRENCDNLPSAKKCRLGIEVTRTASHLIGAATPLLELGFFSNSSWSSIEQSLIPATTGVAGIMTYSGEVLQDLCRSSENTRAGRY